MRTAVWQFGWRLVLAFALAVAPWPPAAFAAVVAAPTDATPVVATQAMPCHDTQPAAAAPQGETGCPDECCADPACDPTHCVVVPAGVAALRLRAPDAVPTMSTRFARVLDRPPTLPVSEQLRPPIV